MKRPNPTDPKIKKIMESQSEDFLLDVRWMRRQLDISPTRFCEILIRCGAPTSLEELLLWESHRAVPDWRQRIALKRVWETMKLMLPEWNNRSIEDRAFLHYTRAGSGRACSSPSTSSRSGSAPGSSSRISH